MEAEAVMTVALLLRRRRTKADETAVMTRVASNAERLKGLPSRDERRSWVRAPEAEVPEVPVTEQQMRRSTGRRQSVSEKSSLIPGEERQQQEHLPQSLTTGRVSSEVALGSDPCDNVTGADLVCEGPVASEYSQCEGSGGRAGN